MYDYYNEKVTSSSSQDEANAYRDSALKFAREYSTVSNDSIVKPFENSDARKKF
jgi:hypothetical protein